MSRFTESTYGIGANASPHDLLKLVNWKEYKKVKYLSKNLREKCPELSKTISGHRRWEADFPVSDLSRLRIEYTYWERLDLEKDPFLVQVHGNQHSDQRKRECIGE